MKNNWRPDGWEDPYREIEKTWEYHEDTMDYELPITVDNSHGRVISRSRVEVGIDDFEAGADAMLEALRTYKFTRFRGSGGTIHFIFPEWKSGQWVFIPDDKDIKY